jgi:hypothetical protein
LIRAFEDTKTTKGSKAAVASRREAAVSCGSISKSQMTNQSQPTCDFGIQSQELSAGCAGRLAT